MMYLAGFASANLLREKLFSNYSYQDMPGDKVDMSLGLAVRSLNNVDHVDGNVEANIWLRHYWNDKRLSWDENEYNQSNIIVFTDPESDNRIWVPDIYLYNTGEKPMEQLTYSNAIVYSSGDVIWSRPGIIKSTCLFNLKKFPYDVQDCYLKFGSWVYNGNLLNLSISSKTDLSNFKQGEEWKIVDTSEELEIKYYECCPEPYHSIFFHLVIERMAEYYVRNIIVPIFATSSLLVISMIIPWDSGERISFTTTVMLSIVVFLLILSDNLPKTNDIPIMSSLVTGLMFFSLGVVFVTVVLSSMRSIDSKESLFGKYIFRCITKACAANRCKMVENETTNRRSISYSEAIDIISENELNEECKKYSLYIEHTATLIFTIVFITYCLVAMFIV